MGNFESELSFFWECPYSQMNFRGRVDALMGTTLIELKTTSSAEPKSFSRHAYNLHYDLSLHHYIEGLRQCGREVKDVVFLVAETSAPYVCEKYIVGESFLQTGQEKWIDAIGKLERGHKENRWASYVDEWACDAYVLEAPAWAKTKNEVTDGI